MSSQRYSSETRTFHDENRRGVDTFDSPYSQRVNVPIQHSTNNFTLSTNEHNVQERLRHHDTTVQWVNDPITGKEKFRVNINIEGFSQNEVNIRVDGNKLLVNGEHVENKNDGTAKKSIEKSFELPHDIDTFSPHVTFPTATKMQVDFPSRHSNAIIDDGRTSSKLVSNFDTSYRSPPRFSQEKSSTEYTSTRKLGGNSGGIGSGSSYERSSSPRSHSPYDQLYGGNNAGRGTNYSSTSQYQSRDNQNSTRQGFIDSQTESFNKSNSPTYSFRVAADDTQPKTIFPSSSSRGESGSVQEKTYSETHRESHHRRSSPTTGEQSSHEVEHQRSGSPSIAKSFDDDRFRSSGLSIAKSFDDDRFRSTGSSITKGLDDDRFRSTGSSIAKGFDEDRFRSTGSSITKGFDEDRFRSSGPSITKGFDEDCFQSSGSSITKGFDEDRFRSSGSSITKGFDEDRFRSTGSSITKGVDEDRFRPSVSFADRSVIPPVSSRNVEVREFSRRVGSGGNNDNDKFSNNESTLFDHGFNSDAFYRSAFQPQVSTGDRGEKRVEMKLDVNNYEPNEVKVSVNGNDLIVQAEHSVERPPTSSTRAYFYKQITLPPNTDLTSLSSQYHPNGQLHISAKLSLEKASIRHN